MIWNVSIDVRRVKMKLKARGDRGESIEWEREGGRVVRKCFCKEGGEGCSGIVFRGAVVLIWKVRSGDDAGGGVLLPHMNNHRKRFFESEDVRE